MSLSDLAALGSFVSGVAVLASLLFLYFQMRQMNEQVKQSERNQQALIQMGRSTRLIDMIYRLRSDPLLRSIFMRGRNGDTSMPPDEIETFLFLNYASFLNFEDTYVQSRSGTIHRDAWEIAATRLQRFLASPGTRVSWRTWRSNFGSDFVGEVDQIVSQARASSSPELGANWLSDIAEEQRLSAK